MGGVVLFLGGNGHAGARLDAARAALACRTGAPSLLELPYPGFEGRPRAESLEAFFATLESAWRAQAGAVEAAYASGIGALIALGLRERGALRCPLIFQGPVLWGLEKRVFPKVMRWNLARNLLIRSFGLPWVQNRLAKKLFLRPLDEAARARFFEGYARCASFGDLFRWFTPRWLRSLERGLAKQADALEDIQVWVGGRDRVVGRREMEWTEQALKVRWPVVEFPGWGHYPMIDEPKEWADALCHALAAS